MRFNSPTVAGAALDFFPLGRNITSFPFNLTRTNDGQAPEYARHYESLPFFFNHFGQRGFSLLRIEPGSHKLRLVLQV